MGLLVCRGVRAPGRARLAAHRDARASGRRQGFEAIFSRLRRASPAEPGKYRGPCAARERERESCVQGAPRARTRAGGGGGRRGGEQSEEHRGAKHAGGAYRKSTELRGPMMRRPWPNRAPTTAWAIASQAGRCGPTRNERPGYVLDASRMPGGRPPRDVGHGLGRRTGARGGRRHVGRGRRGARRSRQPSAREKKRGRGRSPRGAEGRGSGRPSGAAPRAVSPMRPDRAATPFAGPSKRPRRGRERRPAGAFAPAGGGG